MFPSTEDTGNNGTLPKKHSDVYEAISPVRLAETMKGKVVFITGAGRGIGRAIAFAFAEAGANVALLARTKSQLDEVADIIRSKFGRKALVFPTDVVDAVAVQAAVDTTERSLGSLDIVVPNAGASIIRPFEYTPFDDWWSVMEINLKAPMMLARMVLEGMRKRNSGSIIFISSRAGVHNLAGMSAYSVSKTALLRGVACLQLELDAAEKSNIHMYTLHPGGVRTEMTRIPIHPDIEKMKPGLTEIAKSGLANMTDTPELCAWTCVYLATGKAAEYLRGRYIDVEYDVEDLVKQGEIVQKKGLYDLTIKMLGDTSS